MPSLTRTKTLFAFTSPRSPEKLIPEVRLLTENFSGQIWEGGDGVQADFYDVLFDSDFFQGTDRKIDRDKKAFAARDRITRAPKSLGFVKLGGDIQLTDPGRKFIEENEIEDLFARQLMKFQLPSPYHTQSKGDHFCIKPYLELLRFIRAVGSVSKKEVALFFVPVIDHNLLDEEITKLKAFREEIKNRGGEEYDEIVENKLREKIEKVYEKEIEDGTFDTREGDDDKDHIGSKVRNLKDYADAFIRYLMLTGLISFERGTYNIRIAPLKDEEVDFLLDTVDPTPTSFESLEDFQDYLFNVNRPQLFYDESGRVIEKIRKLNFHYNADNKGLDELRIDLQDLLSANLQEAVDRERIITQSDEGYEDILNTFNQISRKEIINAPLILEWNVYRVFLSMNYAVEVKGNFKQDANGLPLHFAPGKLPDIEINYDEFELIVEVTMSGGQTQYRMENESVPRHFGRKRNNSAKPVYCLFIAPKISDGTLAHFFNLNKMNTDFYGGKTNIIPLSIDSLIELFRRSKIAEFSRSQLLREWMQGLLDENQHAEGERSWYKRVNESVPGWC